MPVGALVLFDAETTGLPQLGDWADTHLLEVTALAVDFDLNCCGIYSTLIKPTREAVESLRRNPDVVATHKASGLLQDLKTATKPVIQVDEELEEWVQGTLAFKKGEFALAGHGVAGFDLPLIQAKLPKFASWLSPHSYDMSSFTRVVRWLTRGRPVVNPVPSAFQDGKKILRTQAMVSNVLEEMTRYRDYFQTLP